jgi:hypothetical protein
MSKISSDDWRRNGQEFLKGVKLIAQDYFLYSSDWDHDHCSFCGAKFSMNEGDLKRGYSTTDSYHWICEECFQDFKEEFDWEVIEK